VESPEPPPRPRTERGARDLAISLLVLLIPVVVVVGIYRVVKGGDRPVVIDPKETVAAARAANAFPVAVPEGLPSGWRPVRAAYRTDELGPALRIGYLTPSGAGVQLIERPGATDIGPVLRPELSPDARPQGTVSAGGRTWQRYSGRPGELGLVLLEPRRTTLVVGAAEEAELTQLAASLRG
jgi:hypothetical protein